MFYQRYLLVGGVIEARETGGQCIAVGTHGDLPSVLTICHAGCLADTQFPVLGITCAVIKLDKVCCRPDINVGSGECSCIVGSVIVTFRCILEITSQTILARHFITNLGKAAIVSASFSNECILQLHVGYNRKRPLKGTFSL